MRPVYLLFSLLAAGCVLDRTGQSATETWRREMALQATRAQSLQAGVQDAMARIEQLEEVTRARGQEEIYRMETVDQLRNEVARLRGDLEVLQYESGMAAESRTRLLEDVDYRLSYLEARAHSLESSLGLATPPPPLRGSDATDGVATGDTGKEPPPGDATAGSEPPPQVTPDDAGPAELLALAEEHATSGRQGLARTVAERVAQDPRSTEPQKAEARFRVGNAHYEEGRYQDAILAFQEVVEQHPDSEWAPRAMLRQGQSFERLGQKQNADLFYDDVIRLYPRSAAAKEARTLKGR